MIYRSVIILILGGSLHSNTAVAQTSKLKLVEGDISKNKVGAAFINLQKIDTADFNTKELAIYYECYARVWEGLNEEEKALKN